MSPDQCLLVKVLRDPENLNWFTLQQWDEVIRQARVSRLLGTLAFLIKDNYVLPPNAQVDRHLESARTISRANERTALWELRCLERALQQLEIPVVLLKGAAYVAESLPNNKGRLYGDIDLLVPESEIPKVEDMLLWHGWTGANHNDYDQRYYRQWMHELPPLEHIKRHSILDVHHRLLPRSARITVDATPFIADSIPCSGNPFFNVLSPVDLIIHSCVHLFSDGELDHGLRDLYDLHCLLLHNMKQDKNFLDRLIKRANSLNVSRLVHHGLRYWTLFFEPTVPLTTTVELEDIPSHSKQRLIDKMMVRSLLPIHSTTTDRFSAMARLAAYCRGHYLRMPWKLLLPHLLHKAMSNEESPNADQLRDQKA